MHRQFSWKFGAVKCTPISATGTVVALLTASCSSFVIVKASGSCISTVVLGFLSCTVVEGTFYGLIKCNSYFGFGNGSHVYSLSNVFEYKRVGRRITACLNYYCIILLPFFLPFNNINIEIYIFKINFCFFFLISRYISNVCCPVKPLDVPKFYPMLPQLVVF